MKLRPYQEEVYNFIINKQYSLINFWMRSGKTYPVCKAIQYWNKRTLIITPPKVIPVWKEHLKHFKNKNKVDIISIGQFQKRELDLDYKVIQDYDFEVVVIDEIHQCKSFSNRFRNVRKFTDYAKIRVGLSATPFESDYEDLFYILQLLDRGKLFGTNKQVFQENFCHCINPFSDYPKFEFKKELLPELKNYLKSFTKIFKPPEIQEPKQFSVPYHLTREQKELINIVEDNKPFSEIKNESLYWSPAAKHIKVKQIFGGFLYYGELSSETQVYLLKNKSPLWHAVKCTLRAFKGKQILVWYNFTQEIHLFKAIVKENNLGEVAEFSTKNFKKFKRGEINYLVCHPKSAGQGLDFSFCSILIYLSLPDSMIDYIQSLYRLSKYDDLTEKFIWYMIPHHPGGDKTLLSLKKKMKKLLDFYANCHSVKKGKETILRR